MTLLSDYEQYLIGAERADTTVAKYRYELRRFVQFAQDKSIQKELVMQYKAALHQNHAAASVNAALSAVNGLLAWLGWHECRVKPVRVQQKAYRDPAKELTREEYYRLLKAAKARKNERLYGVLQTICATGIRVSELQFITVEAVGRGFAEVNNKGKSRTVFLSKALKQYLIMYCQKMKIASGSVFVTASGHPLHRCNIWAMMKALCKTARVVAQKVFPHNLRHLFARVFYQQEHDLEHLASILGHSNLNTTRIYTRTTGLEYRRQMERMKLVM